MKTVKFKSITTHGDISHTYVCITMINDERIINIVQKILIDKKDFEFFECQHFKIIYTFGNKVIIYRQTSFKESTFRDIAECLDILLTE